MSVAVWATYRAECIPHKTGCRYCGTPLKYVHRAYCSHRCRRAFEMDHFWGTARLHAIHKTREGYDRERYVADGSVDRGKRSHCAKCGCEGAGEVNHIRPLNGNRPFFGCCHHQLNLEALCRKCHKEETRRQWRAGEIKPRQPRATPLLDSECA